MMRGVTVVSHQWTIIPCENKDFYRHQRPRPAKELPVEFWKLEKEAEKLLEGLGQ